MNTTILGNPKPDDGYSAILGALAPHAAPAEGTLGGTTPSVHNRVKQTFINPVATYPFIARKWSCGWEQTFHAGDLMFVYTGRNNDDTNASALNKESSVHTRRHTLLANLPVLNTVMSSTDPQYKQFQMVESWNFIGVMRNSSAASNEQPRAKNPRGGNALVPDRIINIDVRGSTRMFNYWENARAGSHLYLAWRELDMGHAYRHNLDVMASKPKRKSCNFLPGTQVRFKNENGNDHRPYAEGTVVDQNDDTDFYTIKPNDGGENKTVAAANVDGPTDQIYKNSSTRWQLLPYSEGRDDSNRSYNYKPVKVWWSEQVIAHMTFKRPLCVGWVFQGLGKGERSDNGVAIRQATQLGESRFKLPMIHTFLHV